MRGRRIEIVILIIVVDVVLIISGCVCINYVCWIFCWSLMWVCFWCFWDWSSKTTVFSFVDLDVRLECVWFYWCYSLLKFLWLLFLNFYVWCLCCWCCYFFWICVVVFWWNCFFYACRCERRGRVIIFRTRFCCLFLSFCLEVGIIFWWWLMLSFYFEWIVSCECWVLLVVSGFRWLWDFWLSVSRRDRLSRVFWNFFLF